MPAARLFLCTRPPSYFDVARRWLYRAEADGFSGTIFQQLLDVVNALRGTYYWNPIGYVHEEHAVSVVYDGGELARRRPDPRIILGNFVVDDADWEGAATRVPGSDVGKPRLSLGRLRSLNRVLEKAARATSQYGGRASLLVLPELSLPRPWFRTVSHHVVKFGGFGMLAGLEYRHHPQQPYVSNQAFVVLPGPYSSVATWPWTKRLPARSERAHLSRLPTPVSYPPAPRNPRPRTAVNSPWGRFSVLVCSELIESRRVADLLGRVELVLCPAWNTDTASYDHLIQSAGLQLHAVIAISNNGSYSDCRAWAPLTERWKRDLCRLIERGVNDVVHVEPPLKSLAAFHLLESPFAKFLNLEAAHEVDWRPLPPDWPAWRFRDSEAPSQTTGEGSE